jgi:hypothetical protein
MQEAHTLRHCYFVISQRQFLAYLICKPARYDWRTRWYSFADGKRANFAQERLCCATLREGRLGHWVNQHGLRLIIGYGVHLACESTV